MTADPPPAHAQGPAGEWRFDPGCWFCQAFQEAPARRRLWGWRLHWPKVVARRG